MITKYAETRNRFAAKARTISEILAEHPRAERKPLNARVAFHDSDTQHDQGGRRRPGHCFNKFPARNCSNSEIANLLRFAGIYHMVPAGRGKTELGRPQKPAIARCRQK